MNKPSKVLSGELITAPTEKDRPPHRFKPGQSGNPHGRKLGSRNRLSDKFLTDLMESYEIHGRRLIDTIINIAPLEYLRIVARLVPKEMNLNVRQPVDLDPERRRKIAEEWILSSQVQPPAALPSAAKVKKEDANEKV
jgi:hypothetical protein